MVLEVSVFKWSAQLTYGEKNEQQANCIGINATDGDVTVWRGEQLCSAQTKAGIRKAHGCLAIRKRNKTYFVTLVKRSKKQQLAKWTNNNCKVEVRIIDYFYQQRIILVWTLDRIGLLVKTGKDGLLVSFRLVNRAFFVLFNVSCFCFFIIRSQ